MIFVYKDLILGYRWIVRISGVRNNSNCGGSSEVLEFGRFVC